MAVHLARPLRGFFFRESALADFERATGGACNSLFPNMVRISHLFYENRDPPHASSAGLNNARGPPPEAQSRSLSLTFHHLPPHSHQEKLAHLITNMSRGITNTSPQKEKGGARWKDSDCSSLGNSLGVGLSIPRGLFLAWGSGWMACTWVHNIPRFPWAVWNVVEAKV